LNYLATDKSTFPVSFIRSLSNGAGKGWRNFCPLWFKVLV